MDFDADSAERLYYSDQPVKISKAIFSIRKGLQRVLEALDIFNIRTTFFTPGWVIEHYQDLVNTILRRGHEIGMHGYQHEKLNELSAEEEWSIHEKSFRIIKQIQGHVHGFRRPYWEISPHTLKYITDLGLLYDSSLLSDDEPYIMRINNKELVELPIHELFDDWFLFEIQYRSTDEVLRIWKYEFDAAREEGLWYFPIIIHPTCIGRASRKKMLKEFIIYLIKNGASFLRGIDIARKTIEKTKNVSQNR